MESATNTKRKVLFMRSSIGETPGMTHDLHAELTLLRDLGYTHLDLSVKGTSDEPAPEADETLDDLSRIALACTKCKLAGTRTQVVYGIGNPNADLMFIGEAP